MLKNPVHSTIDSPVAGEVIDIDDRVLAGLPVKYHVDAKQGDAKVLEQNLCDLSCKLVAGRDEQGLPSAFFDMLDTMSDAYVLDVVRVIVVKAVVRFLQVMECGRSCLQSDAISDGISFEKDAAMVLDILLCDHVV